jgi:hypothetical protein
MGERIGYQRVSTVDQNTDRQLDGVAVTALIEIPQVCSLKFPTCGRGSVYRLAGASGGSS